MKSICLMLLVILFSSGCMAGGAGFNSLAEGYVQGYSVGQGGIYVPRYRPKTLTCLPWHNGVRCIEQ